MLQLNPIILDFARRAAGTESPLLANYFFKRRIRMPRPTKCELLRALNFCFGKLKPDPAHGPGSVKDETDRLLARFSRTPARTRVCNQGRLYREVWILRCEFDADDSFEIEPFFFWLRPLVQSIGANHFFPHNPFLPLHNSICK